MEGIAGTMTALGGVAALMGFFVGMGEEAPVLAAFLIDKGTMAFLIGVAVIAVSKVIEKAR